MKPFANAMCTVAALVAMSSAAHAQSLKQREMIASDKKEVAEHLAGANQQCGSHVQINTDYSTFADYETAPDNTNQQRPWAFIVNVTDAMDRLCRSSPEAKQAIAAKLKTVNVRHSATENVSYGNGVLTYAVPYSHATVDSVLQVLRDNL